MFMKNRVWAQLYINFGCLTICLFPKNTETAEPIGPKFFMGTQMTPGKFIWTVRIKNVQNLFVIDH